jgi:hypothetical protein
MPRREKVDPWFLKPYEPTVTPQKVDKQESSTQKSKPRLAALLGGLPKP